MERAAKDRILWIDCARGIAITAIVVGHSGVCRPAVELLYSFHVPIFFLLSGMLLHRDCQFGTFLRNKVKTLLLPYICGYCILSMMAMVLPGQETPPVSDMVRGFICANGEHGHWFTLNLWFIPCLFLICYISNGSVNLFGRRLGNVINFFPTAILGGLSVMWIAQKAAGITANIFGEIGRKSIYIYIYISLTFLSNYPYIHIQQVLAVYLSKRFKVAAISNCGFTFGLFKRRTDLPNKSVI